MIPDLNYQGIFSWNHRDNEEMVSFTTDKRKRVNLNPQFSELPHCTTGWQKSFDTELHSCSALSLIFWQFLKSPSDSWLYFPIWFLSILEIFIFPKKHHCCFCPGIKRFVWIGAASQQQVSTNCQCFLDKDGYCSLKRVHLFEWRDILWRDDKLTYIY